MRTYITNNCGCLSFFFEEQKAYDHPFIGCLFMNDLEYVKLSNNLEYYLSLIPRFSEPNPKSKWAEQTGSPWYIHKEISIPYPVMYLDDIEIHWIHESNSEELLEKYTRRVQRYKELSPTPVFLLSCADLMNNFSKEERQKLIKDFNGLYLTRHVEDTEVRENVFFVEEWSNYPETRNENFIPIIHTVLDRIKEYKKYL